MQNPDEFLCLGQRVGTGNDWSDSTGFQALLTAFDALDVSHDDQSRIWSIVAGIMHLGNITFDGTMRCRVRHCVTVLFSCSRVASCWCRQRRSATSCVLVSVRLLLLFPCPAEDTGHGSGGYGSGGAPVAMVATYTTLRSAAALLGLDTDVLSDMLVKCNSGTVGPMAFDTPVAPEVAETQRRTLVSTLYTKLFGKVLSVVNGALSGLSLSACLGFVDLPGFEAYDDGNGLEQLLFNFADEKLLVRA